MHSQIILKKEPRISNIITNNGDTLIQFKLKDARLILIDLYEKQINDSLLSVYKFRDSLNLNSIELYKKNEGFMLKKIDNLQLFIDNDSKIIGNKDTEIDLLNKTISLQKNEIKRQKFFKILGISGAVILPIITVILIHK